MTRVYGCSLHRFHDAATLLAWVNGKGPAIADAADISWLLAHCNDGVVWGKWDTGQNR